MQRPIKFRALDHNNVWHYGGPDTESLADFFRGFEEGYDVTLKEETLGQSTALHDKNDKEIYEGDVVRAGGPETYYTTGDEKIMVVDDAFNWYAYLHDSIINHEEPEIIGNIYENYECSQCHSQEIKMGAKYCDNCGMSLDGYSFSEFKKNK